MLFAETFGAGSASRRRQEWRSPCMVPAPAHSLVLVPAIGPMYSTYAPRAKLRLLLRLCSWAASELLFHTQRAEQDDMRAARAHFPHVVVAEVASRCHAARACRSATQTPRHARRNVFDRIKKQIVHERKFLKISSVAKKNHKQKKAVG